MSSAAEGTPAEFPATDHQALDRLERFGGRKLLREMIALFLDSAPQRLASVAVGDAIAAENAFHALRSSSAQLGARRLSRLCEQGESAAGAGSMAAVAALLTECGSELRRVEAWLASVPTEDPG